MDKKSIIPVILIIAISLISYINVFKNEFVWDDHVFILENSDIRSFSNLPMFFKEDVDGLYRPLRSFHYTLIYSISGKNEFIYHFNSIFLHTVISILVFLIIFEIINKKRIALVASLIFASHPIHTGRVTNITAGFDLLGIFFMLFSFYLYIRFSKINSKKFFLFSILFFILAVFSSEEAVTLPLIIILYDLVFNNDKALHNKELIKNKIIKSYLAYFIIVSFYLALRFFVLGIKGRLEEHLAGSFYLTILTMLKVYVYYIYLLIVPINLSLFHDIEIATSFFNPRVFLSAVILIFIFFFTIKYHKNKILFFSVFWFFITLLPMSNILPLQVFMAERYLYVPSIAFSLLASYLLFLLYNFEFKNIKNIENKKLLNYIIIVFFVLLLTFYAVRTIDRNNDWKDNLTLWTKTISTNPGNSRAHDNLGFTYERSGEIEKALSEFELAVELQPDNFRAWANLGVAYAKLGSYNKSVVALEKSIHIRPYHKTYDKLGLVYVELGQEEKSIEVFKEAIKLDQRYAKAHNDLGTVYGKIGEFEAALQHFNTSIRIDKDYADAHYNLGILLEFLGEKDKARKEFEIAASLEPNKELYLEKLRS